MGDSYILGRQRQIDIVIADLSVSRQHCVLERDSGAPASFHVRDLGSFNGTHVNDEKILECELKPGDRIRLGNCEFVFELSEALSIVDDDSFVSTIQGAPELFVQIPEEVNDDAEIDRYAAGLSAAFALSTELQTHTSLQSLCESLLRHCLEALPACYAAFILTEPDEGREWKIFHESREFSRQTHRSISQELIKRSLSSLDLMAGRVQAGPYPGAEGETFLIAPLNVQNQAVGVLYAIGADSQEFDRYHLRFAAMAARTAAPAILRVMESEKASRVHAHLLSEIVMKHEIVGRSPAIRAVLGKIQKASGGDASVLISGESGTGKELAARALHLNSPRAGYPLLAFNCAALSESLIESELFGHERGAFTGALQRRRGIFEQANGSTLFLDEIGELPLSVQAKLLRVLERQEIVRLGGEKTVPVNFRLIAATNRDLAQEVQNGKFRADLLYRIRVVSITMPPLRERKDDILPIAEHFLAEFTGKASRKVSGFSPRAKNYLEAYGWPGNVRELRNAVEHAVLFGAAPEIETEDFPEAMPMDASIAGLSPAYHAAVAQARRAIILEAFAKARGNHSAAATALGVHPNNLHRMIRELGLRENIAATRTGNG